MVNIVLTVLGLQADTCQIFEVPPAYLHHEGMLLEAGHGKLWSAPVAVPLLTASSDDMDDVVSGLPEAARPAFLQSVGGFIGERISCHPRAQSDLSCAILCMCPEWRSACNACVSCRDPESQHPLCPTSLQALHCYKTCWESKMYRLLDIDKAEGHSSSSAIIAVAHPSVWHLSSGLQVPHRIAHTGRIWHRLCFYVQVDT